MLLVDPDPVTPPPPHLTSQLNAWQNPGHVTLLQLSTKEKILGGYNLGQHIKVSAENMSVEKPSHRARKRLHVCPDTPPRVCPDTPPRR